VFSDRNFWRSNLRRPGIFVVRWVVICIANPGMDDNGVSSGHHYVLAALTNYEGVEMTIHYIV